MMTSKSPDILFFLSDQHNAFVTGCYGDPVIRTPNLDALAGRGIVFDNAYAAAPVCVPSRMSLLTGCYPFRQDCWTNTDQLAADRPTYAHALAAAGQRPQIIGRMHSLGPDQLRGFSARFVGDHSPNHAGAKRTSMGPLEGTAGPGRQSLTVSGAGQSAYEVHDNDVVKESLRVVDELAAERAGGSLDPFFVHVGMMLPHQPYVADPGLFAYYLERVSDPQLPPLPVEEDHPYHRLWKEAMDIASVGPEETRRARAAYYALTETMDRLIGRVIKAFEDGGLLDNTLVVYCSDHGDQIGERGLWWKHSFYEQSARVPLIMSWPGRFPAGERRQKAVNLVDLAPTFVEASGASELPAIDGVSLLPFARNSTAPWIDETFSEYCTDGLIPGMPYPVQQRMIRTGPWKAIYYGGYPMQLFNLEADPLETRDLAGDPNHAPVMMSLKEKILSGWNPREISEKMTVRKARKLLLGQWATRCEPEDRFRWKLKTEDNWIANT